MKIVDLTLTLQHGMRGVEFETAKTIENDGWNAKKLHIYSHAGTHLDAPVHFNVNKKNINDLPLSQCIGKAWVARVTCKTIKKSIRVTDLGDIAKKIEKNDSLLIQTGWSKYVNTPAYRNELPRISIDLADWCVKKQIKMLGVEAPSIADVFNLRELTSVHSILMRGNVTIIEGLTNLEALPDNAFQLYAIPLKIKDGDGSPARVFAITDDATC